jgi:hypothetical protein
MVYRIKRGITTQPLPITINADYKTYSQAIDRLKTVEGIVEELESIIKSMPKTTDNKKETNRKVQILFANLI